MSGKVCSIHGRIVSAASRSPQSLLDSPAPAPRDFELRVVNGDYDGKTRRHIEQAARDPRKLDPRGYPECSNDAESNDYDEEPPYSLVLEAVMLRYDREDEP
ncbi:hypothetical protein FQN53_002058 [Emmonsiellopsis sp. PD_33]|nr:hypothetical protein FQN53_002058 [Emmonsiellopsis sp. PD_33]